MKILNFGSLNLDQVFSVDHIVKPGETTASTEYKQFTGGKGLNQSIALAKAGTEDLWHAGATGKDGMELVHSLNEMHISTEYIKISETPAGRAIIQVDKTGQNSIVLLGGANRSIEPSFVDSVLANFSQGDVIVLQNEISSLDYIIEKAANLGMRIVLNPSPIDDNLKKCRFDLVSLFLINETEGYELTGEKESGKILEKMSSRYPDSATVLTLGGDGVCFKKGDEEIRLNAFDVKAVDTTAAGDTFTGFFVAGYFRGTPVKEVLETASLAAAISVSRNGACGSIPSVAEVESMKGKIKTR